MVFIKPLVIIVNLLIATLNDYTGKLFQFKEKTTVDLLKEANYPVETHSVTTEDGYILSLHRIPHGKNSSNATKGPVLLVHGLLCSSADWIVMGSESLGLILADAGYDVWLGNNRGNIYSRNHVSLSPVFNKKEFFDYSYHDLGKFDLPATIDFVLKQTGVEKLPYVGFSEGTTQFWVMMSEKPEYNEKILQANFWAPVTDMYRIGSVPINILAKFPELHKIAELLNFYELFAHVTVGNIARALCQTFEPFCNEIFHLIGSSWDRMPNMALKEKILLNFPAGMSLKQVFHYVQGTQSGVFRPYDYGSSKNKEIYNQETPDPYNISAVQVPVTLYYGGSDIFVNNEILINDVASQMPNVTKKLLPFNNFNHLDFIYATPGWLANETLSALNEAVETA